MSLKYRIPGIAMAVMLLSAPARAADVSPYLPADTEIYVLLNIRQTLDSPIIKNTLGAGGIRDLINSQEEIASVLKELDLDPVKDIDKIIAAMPSTGEEDKGLVIFEGRFNLEKFKARAAKEARENRDVLKILTVNDGQGGKHTVYEIVISDQQRSMFLGLASKNVIVASAAKDYLVDALRVKPDATKAELKNKTFAEMITKIDDRQSFAMVMLANVLEKAPINQQEAKAFVAKLSTISAGVTLTEGLKIDLSFGAKTADDAKVLKDDLSNGVNQALITVGFLAMQNKELAPVADLLKSIRITIREKVVSMKAELSAEDLANLVPKN